MTRRRISSLLLGATVMSLVTFAHTGASVADEGPVKEVRVGQLSSINSLTLQSLDASGGSFREPLARIGSKVAWKGPFNTYPTAGEAAKAKKIDITSSGLATLINEAKAKSDILIFAIEEYNQVREGIAVRGNAGIKTLQDLKGKKIAVTVPGGTGEYILFRALEEGGISADGITRIHISNPEDAVAAFSTGQVDAIATWDQYFAAAQNVPGATVLTHGGKTRSLNHWVHFVTRDFATRHPQAVKAIFDGLVAGAAGISADAAIIPAAYKRQGAPANIIKTIADWNLKPTIVPIDAAGLKIVQEVARQTHTYGFHDRQIDVTNNVFDVTQVK